MKRIAYLEVEYNVALELNRSIRMEADAKVAEDSSKIEELKELLEEALSTLATKEGLLEIKDEELASTKINIANQRVMLEKSRDKLADKISELREMSSFEKADKQNTAKYFHIL